MHYSIREQLNINILKFECLSKLIRGENHPHNNPVLKCLRFHLVTQKDGGSKVCRKVLKRGLANEG